MTAIKEYELTLSRALIEGLSAIKGLHIWGITDLNELDRRVPTVSFTLDGWRPREWRRRSTSTTSTCGTATITRWP